MSTFKDVKSRCAFMHKVAKSSVLKSHRADTSFDSRSPSETNARGDKGMHVLALFALFVLILTLLVSHMQIDID